MIKALFPDRTPDPAHDEVAARPEALSGSDPFAELREAFAHEQAVLERVLTAARAQHAERHSQLDTWAAELAERERLLTVRSDELERARLDLVEQRSEIVAEYARVQELSANAGSRAAELESAERVRTEIALQGAEQTAALDERGRALAREQAVFESTREQTEVRLAARELAISERDAMVASRERSVREREADFVTEARRLDQRQSALRAAEARLHDAEAELQARHSSMEEAFEQREALLAVLDADTSTRFGPGTEQAPDPAASEPTVPFTTA